MESQLQYKHFQDYNYGRVYCYGYLKLEGPYADLFLYGIFKIHKKSGRRHVLLYNPITKESLFIQYSRYIYTVYTNKFIPEGYEVDHIDNNFTNDNISNLQLLTRKENYEKYRKHYTENIQQNYYTELTCNNCNKKFTRQKKRVEKESFENAYCSKDCETEYRNKYKIEINCACCNKSFLINKQTYTHYKNRNQQNFWCSDNCRIKFKERNLFNFVSKELLEYLSLNTNLTNIANYFKVNKSTIRDWKIKLGLSEDIMTLQRPSKLKSLKDKSYLVINKIPNKEEVVNLLKEYFTITDISDYIKIDKNKLEKIFIDYISPDSNEYNALLINSYFTEGLSIKEVANKIDVNDISVNLVIQKYNSRCIGEHIRPPLLELREMFLNGNNPKYIAQIFGVNKEIVLRWLNRNKQL